MKHKTHGLRHEAEVWSLKSQVSDFKSVPYLSIPDFQSTGFATAAITTRIGGISQDPYRSLNMAYHVDDADEAVTENRRRFCRSLGIDAKSLVVAQQIHGDRIALVDETYRGCGAYHHEKAIPDTDGMITRSHGLTLAVLTADCVPVLVIDPVVKAVGIAHAGWRGALSMIAAKTVLKMQDTFGTAPANCLVALGPCIGPCCYKVGEEVLSQFRCKFGSATCTAADRLDLQKAVEIQLTDIGVEESSILSTRLCTSCNRDLFYSYRAEGGQTGRMMSVIKLN